MAKRRNILEQSYRKDATALLNPVLTYDELNVNET